MMPRQVLVAMLIESGLISVTALLLAQPELVFAGQSERARAMARYGGLLLLCVTFCWSVILGCLMTLEHIIVRI